MLDKVAVVHKGGLVLWEHNSGSVRGNPVNQLVKTVLLEDRAGETSFIHDSYKIQWVLANDLELIIVAVYQHLLALSYVGDLLECVKDTFITMYKSILVDKVFLVSPTDFFAQTEEFNERFTLLLREMEATVATTKEKRPHSPSRKAVEIKSEEPEKDTVKGTNQPTAEGGSEAVTERKLTGKAAQIIRQRQLQAAGGTKPKTTPAPKKAPPTKKARTWGDATNTGPASPADSDEEGKEHVEPEPEPVVIKPADKTKLDGWEKIPEQRSRFANFLRDRFGTREIDEQDLDTILPALRESLTEKNVAQEIADQLCTSVAAELRGKTLANFTGLTTTIKRSMEASLLRILTPSRDINILRDVAKAREQGRPYSIVFCGVNGVGKSTSLSKIAYWLKGNNLKVLIAACDTFRSGAVEQLQVHSRRIGVPVFEKGYKKEDAAVAMEALYKAKREHVDVVLIDTAGRMQDNEPFLKSLAKLIHTNSPDLVLFVGEALVGNDGVDQLRKFNRALTDMSPLGVPPRGIDGIVLTKFDTIDDRVGAAISMVYQSGQPIVFVGVGQSYQDLRTLDPSVVVQTLLK